MQYNEWYEVHWREMPDPTSVSPTASGVNTFYTEHEAWENLDELQQRDDIQQAILFRQSTVELGRHTKASPVRS